MTYTVAMSWKIKIPTKVGKQIIKLPRAAQAATLLLIRDLEKNGPATGGGWKNYGGVLCRHSRKSTLLIE